MCILYVCVCAQMSVPRLCLCPMGFGARAHLAGLQALLVQKKTLMEMNRAREQEVIAIKKKAHEVEERCAQRLRKIARRNALSEEQQNKEIHVFMERIQILEAPHSTSAL